MNYRRIPPPLAIHRLARYLNFLQMLPHEQNRVSSAQISKALGIKASQFRQDFHYFGGFGRPGLGYSKQVLIEALEAILGLSKHQEMVIIGIGHLGTALANFGYFDLINIKIIGLFDSNPKLVGLSVRGLSIQHPEKIAEFARDRSVKFGIITTPKEAAQITCDLLVKAGIRGIWNFTPVQLQAPVGFIVRNEQPSLGLMSLTYQLKELERLGPGDNKSNEHEYSFD